MSNLMILSLNTLYTKWDKLLIAIHNLSGMKSLPRKMQKIGNQLKFLLISNTKNGLAEFWLPIRSQSHYL